MEQCCTHDPSHRCSSSWLCLQHTDVVQQRQMTQNGLLGCTKAQHEESLEMRTHNRRVAWGLLLLWLSGLLLLPYGAYFKIAQHQRCVTKLVQCAVCTFFCHFGFSFGEKEFWCCMVFGLFHYHHHDISFINTAFLRDYLCKTPRSLKLLKQKWANWQINCMKSIV